MAFLFKKFQEVVHKIAKNRVVSKDSRKLQYEADMNRLFLFTSYNRLGKDAGEADIEELVEMASKANISDQEKLVQENIHSQIKRFSSSMDEIFLPRTEKQNEPVDSPQRSNPAPRRSGLSLAVGGISSRTKCPDIPATRPIKLAEASAKLKDLIGYTLDIRPSQIPHEESGNGLFLNGEADVGSVLAIYPGVLYSPAYYRYIPGYPKVDAENPYLISRYDGIVINAKPWGLGGETREVWDALNLSKTTTRTTTTKGDAKDNVNERILKLLAKPLEAKRVDDSGEVIERRNPLALAHYANHPSEGTLPNVMICPYDFPLTDKDTRVYIPNVVFGSYEEPSMKKIGSFWFKYGSPKNNESVAPVLKTLVLVATRALCDEELFLNYRLSNLKRKPEWYTPVDVDEDRRRWS